MAAKALDERKDVLVYRQVETAHEDLLLGVEYVRQERQSPPYNSDPERLRRRLLEARYSEEQADAILQSNLRRNTRSPAYRFVASQLPTMNLTSVRRAWLRGQKHLF